MRLRLEAKKLQRRLDTITCTNFFTELAQLIDNDFLCKLLAGVARSLETEGKIYIALATLNIKFSLTNPIPSDPLYSDELSVHTVFTIDSCQPVQCKLHTAPLNYTLPYSLANPGPTKQQTQLVRCYKLSKARVAITFFIVVQYLW